MDLIKHFMNKNNKNINPSYSIKYFNNRKFLYFNNINNINRENFKNFHINKSLLKIKSVSSSNIHKNITIKIYLIAWIKYKKNLTKLFLIIFLILQS